MLGCGDRLCSRGLTVPFFLFPFALTSPNLTLPTVTSTPPFPLTPAKARRYTSPDEYAFTTNLPAPVIAPPTFPRTLYPNTVNANPTILAHYVKHVVPRITRRASLALAAAKRAQGVADEGELYNDDGNHGSAATVDVELLQAISKRVHYGA